MLELGYPRSYPTFTSRLRARGLRPACEPCRPAKDRPVAVIEHPPGEETQFDWLELPDPPPQWGWGSKAFLLVGALAHSGRWRGVLAESTDQPHVIDALHRICAALGGLTRIWRFDRMATICHPATGRVTASFAAVAKHYGVSVAICPARRGNSKGVVEKANHTAAQRWWRTLADETSPEQAQASLDRWCALRGDTRLRPTGDGSNGSDGKATVVTVAAREPLTALPAPFPAVLAVERTATAQALVAFRGNHYSVPPELARAQVTVSHRLGAPHIELATNTGIVIAHHTLAPAGAGACVRDTGHVLALERAAMAAFTDTAPHRRKQRIPPGPAARAAAAALRTAAGAGAKRSTPDTVSDTATIHPGGEVVVDLARYAAAAQGRNTLQ